MAVRRRPKSGGAGLAYGLSAVCPLCLWRTAPLQLQFPLVALYMYNLPLPFFTLLIVEAFTYLSPLTISATALKLPIFQQDCRRRRMHDRIALRSSWLDWLMMMCVTHALTCKARVKPTISANWQHLVSSTTYPFIRVRISVFRFKNT